MRHLYLRDSQTSPGFFDDCETLIKIPNTR